MGGLCGQPGSFAAKYALQPGEMVQLKAQDGKLLYGRLIKPANFRRAKSIRRW